MGTMVSTGHGTGLVVATGEKTQFGQVFRYKLIFSSMASKPINIR